MTVAAVRRLPGIGFEIQSRQPTEILPRMDVAVFAGFASSGPLHVPVAVEDAAEFAAIFGPDAPLAWDSKRGELLHAYLGPVVRGFFRNGGHRCWVIRLANEEEAEYNYFPIPALAAATIDEDGNAGEISQAFARARSEGSWSDSLELASTLLRKNIDLLQLEFKSSAGSNMGLPGVDVTVRPLSASDVSSGDLLRLTFRKNRYLLMTPVRDIESVSATAASPPSLSGLEKRPPMKLTCGPALWFSTKPPEEVLSPPVEASVTLFNPDGSSSAISVIDWLPADDESITLYLDTTFEKSPDPGTVVQVDTGLSTMWLTVGECSTVHIQGSPPVEAVRISGEGLWVVDSLPSELFSENPACEILSLELRVRQPDNPSARLTDLGFDSDHELYWGSLPADEEMYKDMTMGTQSSRTSIAEIAANPRFPLAGPGNDTALYFPVAMPFIPTYFLGPRNDSRSALERDGLSMFDSSLFLDIDIAASDTSDLLSEADFIRYQSPAPRPLRGIHASLAIEEGTILSIPDAIHRGWSHAVPEVLGSPPAYPPIRRPEWWHFLDCVPPPEIKLVREPERENFLDCSVRVLEPPSLKVRALSDSGVLSNTLSTESGSFILKWSRLEEEDVNYVLEESTDSEFLNPTTIYTGSDDVSTLYGRGAGQYFYRVRAEAAGQTSDWSNGVVVGVGPVPEWTLRSEDDFEPDSLLAIHRSAVRLCGARGDMLAVLSLPSHYREEETIKYVSALKSATASGADSEEVSPLGYGEKRALSYAAVYHPWPITPSEDQSAILRPVPPDGIVCGTIAKRASILGAWIAPANELMKGILALSPVIGPAWYQRFQDEQINLLRREPQGFLCLNSDTLSEDEDLRPINVRRLLSLLRRLALRLGATYVFEPNDAGFRRRVQRGFESMLGYMYSRGAFKGATPESGYQVVTDSTVNPAENVEQGRFVVELRVAPSLPMRFLTVRLIQTGDRALFAIEE